MSQELELFLACSFATEKVGSEGWPSDHGISDIDLVSVGAQNPPSMGASKPAT